MVAPPSSAVPTLPLPFAAPPAVEPDVVVHGDSAPVAAAHPDADWLCRHLLDLADPGAADAVAAKLVRDFTVRFGRAPGPP